MPKLLESSFSKTTCFCTKVCTSNAYELLHKATSEIFLICQKTKITPENITPSFPSKTRIRDIVIKYMFTIAGLRR